jgi:hypothetical protein
MAIENPTWGYTRIRGGLKSLGHTVARNTIKAILKDHDAGRQRRPIRVLRDALAGAEREPRPVTPRQNACELSGRSPASPAG